MPVHFKWDDDQKTILRYIAEGDWNWREYHITLRISLFQVQQTPQPVDCILDLTQATRVPSGMAAHIRTLGKQPDEGNLGFSGRAVVIGLDQANILKLTGNNIAGGILKFGEQIVYFVDDDAAAQTVLKS